VSSEPHASDGRPSFTPGLEGTCTVLLASPYESDHVLLRHILGHSNWTLHGVGTCGAALTWLGSNRAGVLISRRQLPDATWKELLRSLGMLPDPPNLIVCSRLADDSLWAEVLNLGAYDLLLAPFEAEEVRRVVSLAWVDWNRRPRRAAPPEAPQRIMRSAA
jgi:DNA-binding response OmpR family regulator